MLLLTSVALEIRICPHVQLHIKIHVTFYCADNDNITNKKLRSQFWLQSDYLYFYTFSCFHTYKQAFKMKKLLKKLWHWHLNKIPFCKSQCFKYVHFGLLFSWDAKSFLGLKRHPETEFSDVFVDLCALELT